MEITAQELVIRAQKNSSVKLVFHSDGPDASEHEGAFDGKVK